VGAPGLPQGPVSSLVGDPSNPAKFYAAVTSTTVPNATSLYVSVDSGASWSPVFTNATSVTGGNVIASATGQVFARLSAGPQGSVAMTVIDVTTGRINALYLSLNSGQTWTRLNLPSDLSFNQQAGIHSAVAIDPTNPTTVYIAGDTIGPPNGTASAYRVQLRPDGSSSFQPLTGAGFTADGSTIHPDTRLIAFDATGRLIVANDGGIYARTSPQTTTGVWTGLNGNLSAWEIFSVAYDANSKRLVVAAQDTGTALQSAPGSALYNVQTPGDGIVAAVNDRTLNQKSAIYTAAQGLLFLNRTIVDARGNPVGAHPTVGINFDTTPVNLADTDRVPFVLNRIDPTRMAFASDHVFISQDTPNVDNAQPCTGFINIVTPYCVTLHLTDLGQIGTTGQVFSLAYGTNDNPGALLAGVDNPEGQRLFLSTAATPGPGTLNVLPQYAGQLPLSLVFDPRTQARFFVADGENLWSTQNGTAAPAAVTFQTLTPSLPASFIRPYAVEFISNNGVNALLVGGLSNVANAQSPITVADSDASGNLANWRLFGTGLPNAPVTMLAYNPTVDALAVATFGRGAWLLYDVTSNFPQATVLQFGLADNDSNPSASILTDGTALDGSHFVRPLIKYGTGTMTIAGIATYTGTTTINGGTLRVDGSIASSPEVFVNFGGTLGGNGTVGSTTVFAGGTLSPGNPVGTLTVNGNLVFAAASLYMVDVQGNTADRTNVSGTATLAGTVGVANLGGRPARSYTILSAAGGRSGTFDSIATVNLASFFRASLAYTPTDVQLNLVSTIGQTSGLTRNQSAVAAALDNSFNNGGGTLSALLGLSRAQLPAALDMLSGEGVSGTQETAFGVAGMFNAIMMDQGTFWRNREMVDVDGVSFTGEPLAYAAAKKSQAEHPAFKALPKEPPMFAPRWRAWLTGFDGTTKLNGEPGIGSATLSHNTGGLAGGLDYQLAPDLLAGFAIGGSSSIFSVRDRITSGNLEGAHFGGYAVKTWREVYAAAALSLSTFRNSETRSIVGIGPTQTASGSFGSNLLSGRVEMGWKQTFSRFAVTPFAAVQVSQLWQNGFGEVSPVPAGAADPLGLTFGARSVTSLPTFLGAQFDTRVLFSNGMTLSPYARLSWVHEFKPDRAINPSFIALPAAAFTVDGPRAASDAARIDAGAKYAIAPNAFLFASFDGEFSSRSQTYAGKGGERFTW
jgi:outer membrane autotransporter protein